MGKQYFFLDEPVKIVGKRKNNQVLVRYEDGYEEVVDKDRLTFYNVVDKLRKQRLFEQNFGSEARVMAIKTTPCVVCGSLPSQNAHVLPRSRGGRAEHVIPLCDKHHRELDATGVGNFENKYEISLLVLAKEFAEIHSHLL